MEDIDQSKDEESWADSDFLTFGGDKDEDDNNVKEEEKETSEANIENDAPTPVMSRKRSRHGDNGRGNTPGLTSLTAVTELPPWMDRPHSHKFHRSVPNLVLLHDEIVNFAALMAPQPEELKMRQQLVDKVTKLVNETFDNRCEVMVFGSQATGLLLPTSDIDFVVNIPTDEENAHNTDAEKNKSNDNMEESEDETDEEDVKKLSNKQRKKRAQKKAKAEAKKNKKKEKKLSEKEQDLKEMEEYSLGQEVKHSPLVQLGSALQTHPEWKDELTYLEVVENTRVPIVKFAVQSGLSVDICFNQEAGTMAADLMTRFMDAMPPLKALTFVLKYFMAARGLNEPYTGGVGSFMLQMMIVSFLQHRERHAYNNHRNRTANTMNLGSMLLEFFELYGMDFNYLTTGISVRSDGFYFPKGAKGKREIFHQPSRPFSLALENPFDLVADVGRASFRMQLIAKSFEVAMRVLLSHTAEPYVPTESILASILPPTEEMRKRSTMFKVLKIEEKLSIHKERVRSSKKDEDEDEFESGGHNKRQRVERSSSEDGNIST